MEEDEYHEILNNLDSLYQKYETGASSMDDSDDDWRVRPNRRHVVAIVMLQIWMSYLAVKLAVLLRPVIYSVAWK